MGGLVERADRPLSVQLCATRHISGVGGRGRARACELPRARPVPAALSFFTGASQFEDPTGAISAAAIVVTIPIVIVVVIFQRRIVAGLTSGAVKG